jgi:hypothetical protein
MMERRRGADEADGADEAGATDLFPRECEAGKRNGGLRSTEKSSDFYRLTE